MERVFLLENCNFTICHSNAIYLLAFFEKLFFCSYECEFVFKQLFFVPLLLLFQRLLWISVVFINYLQVK
jgi:hypothetical protein